MAPTHRRRFPACLRISNGRWLLIAVFVLSGCATTAGQKPASLLPTERAAAARLEAVRGNPESLRDFFRQMPKGGDLHIHTSGALYPEDLLRIATEKGLCVNPVRGDLSFPPCGPAADAHTLNVAHAADIRELKERLIGLWSVQGAPHEARAANTHFFAVFGKIWPATEDIPAVLVNLRDRAARDHVQYLEVMYRIRDVDNRAAALGRRIGWDDDLTRLRGRLLAAGLEDLVKEAATGIDRRHEESLQRLRCGSAGARPGCGVAVRYQQYANRTLPKEAVFAQFVLAFEIAKRHALVAGVNLVGQENDPTALADFPLHMRMVGTLHGLYPEVKIALHAGELTPELVPQEDLRSHVRDALRTAGADRIGHASDIRHEDAREETLREMAERRVVVEVMPTSNRFILLMEGKHHPFPDYHEKGVPVVLATDDPGILLTDLTSEFTEMALRYPRLSWPDFKAFARNSLEFSFLSGKGLWQKSGIYEEKIEACRDAEAGKTLPAACAGVMEGSPKAALQWALEEKLAAFEEELAVLEALTIGEER